MYFSIDSRIDQIFEVSTLWIKFQITSIYILRVTGPLKSHRTVSMFIEYLHKWARVISNLKVLWKMRLKLILKMRPSTAVEFSETIYLAAHWSIEHNSARTSFEAVRHGQEFSLETAAGRNVWLVERAVRVLLPWTQFALPRPSDGQQFRPDDALLRWSRLPLGGS